MTIEQRNSTLKWIIGLMIPVLIVFVTWIFGAGKHWTDICKIPNIEERVNVVEKDNIAIKKDIEYIVIGIGKLTGEKRNHDNK